MPNSRKKSPVFWRQTDRHSLVGSVLYFKFYESGRSDSLSPGSHPAETTGWPPLNEAVAIFTVIKYFSAANAPGDDVMQGTGSIDAGWAWHAGILHQSNGIMSTLIIKNVR
jgi:hypothetical protein